jgi:RHS repeat-associated protein
MMFNRFGQWVGRWSKRVLWGGFACAVTTCGFAQGLPEPDCLTATNIFRALEFRGYAISRSKVGFSTFSTTTPPKRYRRLTYTEVAQTHSYGSKSISSAIGDFVWSPMAACPGNFEFSDSVTWTAGQTANGTFKRILSGSPTNLGNSGWNGSTAGAGADGALQFGAVRDSYPALTVSGMGLTGTASATFIPSSLPSPGYVQQYASDCGPLTNGPNNLVFYGFSTPDTIVSPETKVQNLDTTQHTPGTVTQQLEDEYTTSQLKAHMLGDITDCRNSCPQPAWGFQANYNACNGTPCGSATTLSAAQASRSISSDELSFSARSIEYRFQFQTDRDLEYEVSWNELTVPAQGARSKVARKTTFSGTGGLAFTAIYYLAPPDVDGTKSITDIQIRPIGPCVTCVGNPSEGSGPTPGNGVVGQSLSGASFSLDLGMGGFGKSAGSIWMQAPESSDQLASPSLLSFAGNTNLSTVLTSGGVLQQIQSPQMLVDVVSSNNSYFLNCYANSNGVYLTNSSPFTQWTFLNPDGTNSYNRLWIVEDRASRRLTNTFDYLPASNQWTVTWGNGLRKEVRRNVWSNTNTLRTETVEVRDVAGALLKTTVRRYQSYNWGEGLLDQVEDVGGIAFGTTNVYNSDGSLSQFTRSDGYWEKYTFSSGKLAARYKPGLNTPSAPTTSGAMQTSYDYSTYALTGAGDDQTIRPDRPRYVSENTPRGNYVTYTVFKPGEEKTIQWGGTGGWSAADNPLTVRTYFTNGTYVGKLKSVQYPDQTRALFDYVDAGGFRTNTLTRGQFDSGTGTIIDGVKEVSVVDAAGQTRSRIVSDIVSGVVTEQDTILVDDLNRPVKVTYLDGTSTGYAYDCCNLSAVTNRDGAVTTYEYDELKRLQAEHRSVDGAGTISFVYSLDPLGNLLSITRYGTNGNPIVLSRNGYDGLGRLVAQTNSLGVVTTYSYVWDSSGQTIKTTAFAAGTSDSVTRIETFARDGSLLSVTGTGVHPERYLITNSGGTRARRTIPLDASGSDLAEWNEERLDTLGRVKDLWSSSYVYQPVLRLYYNNNTQLWKRDTPNGVFLSTYNGKGEAVTNALDFNRNDAVDPAGTDRVARTVSDVVTNHGTAVLRTQFYVWPTNNVNSSVLASTIEVSVDGLKRWDSSWGQTTYTEWSLPINGARTRTTTAPDGTWTIEAYQFGRLVSTTAYDSNAVQLVQTSYDYDEHDRLIAIADSRSGRLAMSYDDADRVVGRSSPASGAGDPPQVTSYQFDALSRMIRVALPDGGAVTNEFHPSGEIKKTYGTRTYPVQYIYDTLGRLRTNTTWQDFAANTGAASTVWNYDGTNGLLTSKKYHDNTGPTYTYVTSAILNRHKVSTRTWARGTVATYTYNTAGEVSRISYNTGTSLTDRNFAYDRLGRMITAQIGPDSHAFTLTNQFSFQPDGTVLKEVQPSNFILTNTYDGLLRRSSLGMHGQTATTATIDYDAAGRVGTVASGTHAASFGYVSSAPGLVANATLKNNGTTRLATSRTYDLLNRLQSTKATSGNGTVLSWNYQNAQSNLRSRTDLSDGSYWLYEYDVLGQVTSGKKFWSDGSSVAGQQFEYSYDSIGNRTSTKVGGDEDGNNLRSASYVTSLLNLTTNRTIPGAIDVMGVASAGATVTANGQATYRKGEYFRKELSVSNSGSGVWQSITNVATQGSSVSAVGSAWLDQTPQVLKYDADGNLTNDGRWTFTWDVENRLLAMEGLSLVPTAARKKLEFTYDVYGRRIQKKVSAWNGSSFVAQSTNKFVYDGWNLIATLDAASSLQYAFLWGNDVSGTWSGAGGVGGLVGFVIPSGALSGTYYYVFDGNGNVSGLVNSSNGEVVAAYEYGPFGEVLRTSGSVANLNPFRFSSKYQDEESDLLYYGYRFYNPSTGKWLSRDSLEEAGGLNLHGFVANNPISSLDVLGQWNYWNVATWGVANGVGWSVWDSLNPFHESNGINGETFDYLRQSLAAATGYDMFGKYDPCDKWLKRGALIGRPSALALEVLGPGGLAKRVAGGATRLQRAVSLALQGWGAGEGASAVGSGLGHLAGGDAYGAFEAAVGAIGLHGSVPGLFNAAKSGVARIANSIRSGAAESRIARGTTTWTRELPSGNGFTDKFGNMTLSKLGSAVDRAQVRIHEGVHSFLSPSPSSILADLRANLRMSVHHRSQFIRYTEEAIAETAAQLGTRSMTGMSFGQAVRAGLRFPLEGDYRLTLQGVGAEAAGGAVLIGGTVHYFQE